MHHFLHIDDFSTGEVRAMLRNAARAKTAFYNRDQLFKPFDKWTMAMIFTKPSARTRVSFETVRVPPQHRLCHACRQPVTVYVCTSRMNGGGPTQPRSLVPALARRESSWCRLSGLSTGAPQKLRCTAHA